MASGVKNGVSSSVQFHTLHTPSTIVLTQRPPVINNDSRVVRVMPGAAKTVVVDNLPVFVGPLADTLGAASVAFIGNTLYVAIAAGPQHGRRRRQHHPQPTAEDPLMPRRFIGVDDAGGPHLIEQVLDDRLAGDADLTQAAVDGSDRQRHPEPRDQELADAAARLMVTQAQRRDEDGQRRTDKAAFAQLQLPVPSFQKRQRSRAGAGRRTLERV